MTDLKPCIITDEMVEAATRNILVLCHGNINRSALSHAVMAHHAGGLLDIKSAGFVNPGKRAAKKMRDAAAARGYNLEDHRSTLISPELIEWADVILYMDGGNMKRLQEKQCSWEFPYICTNGLGEYASSPVHRIPDPAFMKRGSAEFNETVDLIIDASLGFLQELIGL